MEKVGKLNYNIEIKLIYIDQSLSSGFDSLDFLTVSFASVLLFNG